ncbi:phosphatidylinositol transfer protein [Ceratobasidium sp. AG-Ba]|nr:phosphatidylinositol transfer protein [Ceratobasidium sp. AG-Ba]QRW04012.1 phosphatidylinositol transfer protein [Ceratobasidium sp. AG-Ba]
MPVHVTSPPPAAPAANPAAALSDEQENAYGIILKHYSSPTYVIPGIEPDKGTLTEDERFWLTRECFLRYLRASKWVLATTITRLDDTLKWRREYGLYDLLTPEHVEPESLTGKEQLAGYDVQRRPALYMLPSRQNTDESVRQLQFAVWMLERSIDVMGPGVENLDLLINFADRAKNPALGTARTMLNILQNHYPERLGLALITNVPMIVNIFFKAIMPFVDPITRAKIKFNPNVIQEGIFDKTQVMKEWGGEMDFAYEHEKSWPALVGLCESLCTERKRRWHTLGGTVGLSEWDIKGGDSQSSPEQAGVAVL